LRKTKIFFTLFYFLITAFSPIYALDTAAPTSQTATLKRLFPFEKGYRWRYIHRTPEGESRISSDYIGSVSKEGKEYYMLGNPYGVSYFEFTKDAIYHRAVAPAQEPNAASFYRDGDMIRLQMPLEKGNRWSNKGWLEADGQTRLVVSETEILGWNRIEVPAGTYDCLVTSSSLNTLFLRKEMKAGLGSLAHELIWYAPDVGIVQRMKYLVYPGEPEEFLNEDKLEVFNK
jgi:hypothetical protein